MNRLSYGVSFGLVLLLLAGAACGRSDSSGESPTPPAQSSQAAPSPPAAQKPTVPPPSIAMFPDLPMEEAGEGVSAVTARGGTDAPGAIRLAEQTVYQYGGPETRTRCVNTVRFKGIPACRLQGLTVICDDTWVETCNGYATDVMQHATVIVMYGPKGIDRSQLVQIKDACFASAVATQLSGITLLIDTVGQILSSKRPLMETALRACVATTSGLSQLVEKDFRLEVAQRNFW